MDYSSFLNWLISSKEMSQRAAKDVLSRCRRVSKIVEVNVINKDTIDKLNSSEEFKTKSMFIKSQLRRAVCLLCEYEDDLND